MRRSLLSMDLEEWYDLKYLEPGVRDRSLSVADGVRRFVELLERHGVKATFFVLGSFWQQNRQLVRGLHAQGHEIALHGVDHRLLYDVPDGEFREATRRLKISVEDALGTAVEGYRASCFSMTSAKLDILRELGFRYDSSRVEFAAGYVREVLDMSKWRQIEPYIHEREGMVEFGLTDLKWLGRVWPIAGGGYFRLMPWPLFRTLLRRHLRHASLYTFYLHPFETSRQTVPRNLVDGWEARSRFRFQVGRRHVMSRLEGVLELLRRHGFECQTYAAARNNLAASA